VFVDAVRKRAQATARLGLSNGLGVVAFALIVLGTLFGLVCWNTARYAQPIADQAPFLNKLQLSWMLN
jgi:hypothetical protein